MRIRIRPTAWALFLTAVCMFALPALHPAAAAEIARDCRDCPSMVAVPAGSFQMGSTDSGIEHAVSLGANRAAIQDEKPQHQVEVRQFSMSATEVTRNQFEAFVRATGYRSGGPCTVYDQSARKLISSNSNGWRDPGFPQTGDHPVACVSWRDAKAYVGWLSKMTGKQYRLPSEAEWEYAARTRSGPGRHLVENVSDACRGNNVSDATSAKALNLDPANGFPCIDGYVHTAPVAQFQANGFGLNDMLGNVREWTEDCYHSNYNGAPADGTPWLAGDCSLRVFRGGSWDIGPWGVRAEGRFHGSADDKYNYLGFRVARTS